MIVTPETLRNHITWLRSEGFDLVALSTWIERRALGLPLPLKAFAITFDDGWRDNYEFAFPILRESDALATIFAVSHLVGTKEVFWPNRLARLLRTPACQAPKSSIAKIRWIFPDFGLRQPMGDDNARAVNLMKLLTDKEIFEWLTPLEAEIGLPPLCDPELLDWQELRAMADSELVEIGSHGCDHARLTSEVSPAEVAHQVIDSKELLKQGLGRPIRLFCYPNGASTPAAEELVREHYLGAVTTWTASLVRRGANRLGTSQHKLTRIGLHEGNSCSSTGLMAQLSSLF